jgi:hypothetical protein
LEQIGYEKGIGNLSKENIIHLSNDNNLRDFIRLILLKSYTNEKLLGTPFFFYYSVAL